MVAACGCLTPSLPPESALLVPSQMILQHHVLLPLFFLTLPGAFRSWSLNGIAAASGTWWRSRQNAWRCAAAQECTPCLLPGVSGPWEGVRCPRPCTAEPTKAAGSSRGMRGAGLGGTAQAAPNSSLVEACAQLYVHSHLAALGTLLAFLVKHPSISAQFLNGQAQARDAATKAAAAAANRAAAVAALASMAEEPRRVWQAAVDLIQKQIPGVSAYVANIVGAEEPEQQIAGDDEGAAGADDAAEEEAGGRPRAAAGVMLLLAGSGAAAHDVAGEEAEGAGESGDTSGGEGAEDGEHPGAEQLARPDYSSKHLSYVAASPGQEFMTKLELRRRAAAADGSDGAPADGSAEGVTAPVTFRILDEHLPLLEVR